MAPIATDRPLDIVVHGATGFTGQFVVRYLHEHAPRGVKWAVAGRSEEKMSKLVDEVGANAVVRARCTVDSFRVP